MSQKNIAAATRDAVSAYLELHDVSVPAAIEAGVRTAVIEWLDAHQGEVLDAVAARR